MAATAISLQLRPKRRPITNPTFLHFFSSPNPSDSTDVDDQNSPPPQSPFSSYFSDVKSIFKQIQFLEEISKNLSQFRRPSPAPPPRDKSSPASTPQISFQELYKRRSENSTIEASNKGSKSSFEDIRESLRQLRMNNPTNSNNNTTIEASDKGSKPSFEDLRKSLRQDNPTDSNNTTIKVSNKGSKFEAIRESLHQLRMNNPTNNNNNQQGVDLRQSLMEKEMESKFVGFGFTDLRQSLMALRPALEQREEQEANVRRSENSTIQASNKGSGGGPSFDAIRESLHQLKINKSNSSTIQASNKGSGGGPSFDAIRESLHQLKINKSNSNNNHQINNNRDPMSLKTVAQDLKLLLGGPNNVIGGTDQRLPASVFGKEEEMREKEQESPAMRTKFVRGYSYEELGKKLRMLRPPEGKRGGDWFSLGELNERLMKLREVEEKEEKYVGVSFSDLRQSLVRMQLSSEENNKKQMCE